LPQLTVADHASPRSDENYTLDANGNRDDNYYNVGDNNQTIADANYTYVYDKEGNRTERIASDGSKLLYKFDHRKRLTRVEFRSSADVLTKSIDYVYDPFNRLVRRRFDADGAGSGTATDQFFAGFASAAGTGADELANPTLEFDGGTASDLSHRYLWGPAIDQLMADENLVDDEVLWALADQVGTIRDIARLDNGQFSAVNHRVYDSFGNLTSQTNGAVTIAFGFTGKWTDAETGMTHHLFRWYDPKIGKWISEDPLSFSAGDTNLSRYVSNSPLTNVDPLGLDELSINGNADHGGPAQPLLPGDPENQNEAENDSDNLGELHFLDGTVTFTIVPPPALPPSGSTPTDGEQANLGSDQIDNQRVPGRQFMLVYGIHAYLHLILYDDEGRKTGWADLHFWEDGYEVILNNPPHWSAFPIGESDPWPEGNEHLIELWQVLEEERRAGKQEDWGYFFNCWLPVLTLATYESTPPVHYRPWPGPIDARNPVSGFNK